MFIGDEMAALGTEYNAISPRTKCARAASF